MFVNSEGLWCQKVESTACFPSFEVACPGGCSKAASVCSGGKGYSDIMSHVQVIPMPFHTGGKVGGWKRN